MYTENANGALYGPVVQGLRLADSILPMNIIPDLWASLAGDEADFYDPLQNIEAGTRLLKRIIDRLADPTVAKVATLYNSLPKEQVTDLGARTAVVYKTRAWERKPKVISPRIQAEMDRERQALRRRLRAN